MNEYDPQPPFDAGSLKTAPPDAWKPMTGSIAGFRAHAEAPPRSGGI